eukprot:gene3361-6653_t
MKWQPSELALVRNPHSQVVFRNHTFSTLKMKSAPFDIPQPFRLYIEVVILIMFMYASVFFLFLLNNKKSKIDYCKKNERLIAFFHPYCNAGGGGERVLWMTILSLLRDEKLGPHVVIAIYTADDGLSHSDIINNVERKFCIVLPPTSSKIVFVKIWTRSLLEANRYPIMTMLFQSLASVLVGLECLIRFTPDVFVDTMGAAFTYPLVRMLTKAKVIAYVHYPTISKDMLNLVVSRRPTYNNNNQIARSETISSLKLCYYKLFAQAYVCAGRCATLAMVNSSWTEDHIRSLWGDKGMSMSMSMSTPMSITRVYPPCSAKDFMALPLGEQGQEKGNEKRKRKRLILSIGQFRPEKDHSLQLSFRIGHLSACGVSIKGEAMILRFDDVRLVLLGGSRGAEDEALVSRLREEAVALAVSTHTDFVVNASYTELLRYLGEASVGIHTMWNEHFGISVVEMMAAGLVVIAHNSGGPRGDIVETGDSPTGYLADTPEGYAECMALALDSFDTKAMLDLRMRARKASQRFSDEVFEAAVLVELQRVITVPRPSRRRGLEQPDVDSSS